MNKDRINLKISEASVLAYVERNAKKQEITLSRFINNCLKKCMSLEGIEYELQEINKKLDLINDQKKDTNRYRIINQKLDEISNRTVDIKKAVNDIDANTFASADITNIMFQGLIRRYRSQGLDPFEYFKKDYKEVIQKFYNTDDSIK